MSNKQCVSTRPIPGLVNPGKAEKRILDYSDSNFFNLDLVVGGSPASLVRWWSQITTDGTTGDPTVADPGAGRLFLEAAIDATVGLAGEIRALPILKRVDHH